MRFWRDRQQSNRQMNQRHDEEETENPHTQKHQKIT